MAEEKGVALAILGIVAVIAVVGLIMLFQGAAGDVVLPGAAKIYPGKVVSGDVGAGTQYSGEGAYVTTQQGDCLSNEFWTQNELAAGNCRPGARVEVYQRSRKFYGAGDQTVIVDGYCCLKPSVRAPRAE